jgi:hypothetical protein
MVFLDKYLRNLSKALIVVIILGIILDILLGSMETLDVITGFIDMIGPSVSDSGGILLGIIYSMIYAGLKTK